MTIVLFQTQLVLVEGLYVLQAQIHSFVNTNQQSFHCNQFGRQCQLACCDDDNRETCSSGERRCDTFFIFCLRRSGTVGFGCGSNGGSVVWSSVNEDDEINIDFSQGSFLGLSNPVNLPGLTNDWNVNVSGHCI